MKINPSPHILILKSWLLVATVVLAACTPIDRAPSRTLVNVGGGPDQVFARPVAEFLPQLEGATATGVTGRVGNELVFWEYRLRDNREANLFVCAPLENVDCDARIEAVCPGGGQVLAREQEPGQVRRMDCTTVGIAQPGELYPNCQVRDGEAQLLAGLTQCQTSP